MEKIPKVFISYSWTSQEHMDKVIHLATRMENEGIAVAIDKWDLNPGQDKYVFMEQMVNDPDVDKVLMICDLRYRDKANDRTGGVGDEAQIISPQLYSQVQQTKFIPLVFENDGEGNACLPAFLSTRIYIDFTDDEVYEERFEELIRNIYQKPQYLRPSRGKRPEWLDEEPGKSAALRYKWAPVIQRTTAKKPGGLPTTGFRTDFITALSEFEFSHPVNVSYKRPTGAQMVDKIGQLKPLRDIYLDMMQSIIEQGEDITEIAAGIFEAINDELIYPLGDNPRLDGDADQFRYLLWEMVICTVALLRHYERYEEIYRLVSRTYFFRDRTQSSKPVSIDKVSFYSRSIEQEYKPQTSNPRLYSLMGDMLVMREKLPIITGARIVDADLIIFEVLRFVLGPDKQTWFPRTYCYPNTIVEFWRRLISVRECGKILKLFNTDEITFFKGKLTSIAVVKTDRVAFSGSGESAVTILNSISIDEIGSMA